MGSMPALVHAVQSFDANAFNVEVDFPLNDQDIDAFARDIQEAVERVGADDDMAAVFEEHSRNESAHSLPTSGPMHDTEPSTSFAAANGSAEMAGSDASTGSVAHPRQEQLRRQMVSVGKQPKAAQGRKKRDMVESLYDSLTGYFDPSGNRRQRNRNKASEDEREESVTPTRRSEEREATGSPAANASVKSTPAKAEKPEEESKFFDKKSRKRPRPSDSSSSDIPRPPTPTEIIHQREVEWEQKQRQRHEKYRRRQHEDWGDHDAMAENESLVKFSSLIDQITEQVDDLVIHQNEGEVEIAQELLIDRAQLDELRAEAQKLKSWRKVNKIAVDRLVKLLTILEKNIRDVLSDEGSLTVSAMGDADDDSDETYRELVDERLIRAADAACTSLLIMTSSKMPKQVLMEDTIERSVQLCKQYLQQIIYPASDVACKFAGKPRKSENQAKRRKLADDAFSPTTATLYGRMTDLLSCFAELMRSHALNETVVFQLASLATPPFFIDNIGEIQLQAIKLLSTVCARHPAMRRVVFADLLNSLHRLPSNRNQRNCYRLSATEWINNFTVLILQLVQSVVKLPNQKKHTLDETDDLQAEVLDTGIQDAMVIESYDEAQRLISSFLSGFLK
ncbi:CBR-PQN-85 protein, partial [Aphelenchoides avenae]